MVSDSAFLLRINQYALCMANEKVCLERNFDHRAYTRLFFLSFISVPGGSRGTAGFCVHASLRRYPRGAL